MSFFLIRVELALLAYSEKDQEYQGRT